MREDCLPALTGGVRRGSPPHARGRRWRCEPRSRALPAHPRMRGEDLSPTTFPIDSWGSPPHARGRRGASPSSPKRSGAHPRMRGEDHKGSRLQRKYQGSPPHARGRRAVRENKPGQAGLTPACAGKTQAATEKTGHSWAHPRMRGEDRREMARRALAEGSPPHARGRPTGNGPPGAR